MTDDRDELRAEALARFSRTTGAPEIKRIRQRGRDPETARFTLELADGPEVRVGTIKTLWSQVELAKALAVACGVVIQRLKPSDWQDVLAALIALAVDVEETPGERFEDTVLEWLGSYLAGAALEVDKNGAAAQGLPYREDGQVYVSANGLAKYVRREYAEQVKLPELRTALSDLGFERRTVMYQKSGRRSSTSYYVGDAARFDPEDDA